VADLPQLSDRRLAYRVVAVAVRAYQVRLVVLAHQTKGSQVALAGLETTMHVVVVEAVAPSVLLVAVRQPVALEVLG
jgi:hypothetical protein